MPDEESDGAKHSSELEAVIAKSTITDGEERNASIRARCSHEESVAMESMRAKEGQSSPRRSSMVVRRTLRRATDAFAGVSA